MIPANRSAAHNLSDAAQSPPLVMIVEDDPHVRRPIVELLKLHGMRVVEAANADEAHEALARGEPNLVIADVMMRGKPEGFDVCWKIKTNPATNHCYVIMLTGLSDPYDIDNGRERGADQYLVKPVSMGMLWEIISKLGVIIMPDVRGETPPARLN